MKVELWLRGYLRQYIPPDSRKKYITQEIREGTTIGDLLERLKIPGWRIAVRANPEPFQNPGPRKG